MLLRKNGEPIDRSIELLIEQIFHSISHIIPPDRITVGRVQLVFPARPVSRIRDDPV